MACDAQLNSVACEREACLVYFCMKTLAALSVVSAMCLSVTLAKDEEVPDHNLSEWKIGEIISGDDVKLSDLRGKVVAIENWGVN